MIYDAQDRRLRLLVMVEDVAADRNDVDLIFDRSTVHLEDVNITLRWFNTNYDFDMNFGDGRTTNCAVYEYVDRDADGNQNLCQFL